MNRLIFTSVFFLMSLLCVEISSNSSEASSSPSNAVYPSFDQPSVRITETRVWVFFADKGLHSQDYVTSLEHQLPLKTKKRRKSHQGSAINISDLPVFQPYIDGVLQLGATFHTASKWLNGITVEAPDGAVPQILGLPFVKSVERVITYRRKGLESGESGQLRYAPGESPSVYGMSSAQIQQIHVDALHKSGYHGEGITIALLDTGFDLSHEAFQNINLLAEYDFINGDDHTLDNPPEDDIGQDDHGTEVLSIIAGNSPGSLVGVAYAADYLLAKTERVSYEGVMFEQEIEEDWWVAGLEWAEFNGADVVSSSLGYSDWYSYRDMDGLTARTTIAADMAVDKGVMVVVSAGNEGKSRNWPYISAPADGFKVIAVGAVDSTGEVADFSSAGPTYDGRIKPDVVAMGNGTYAVSPNSTNEYRRADGTSLATPLVAGTVALLLQALPDINDPKTLTKLLKYTATKALSPDNHYGWGLINAEAAFKYGKYPYLMEELKDWEPIGTVPDLDYVTVYPNPVKRSSSTGNLTIFSPEFIDEVRIYSLSGLPVYERQDMGNARSLVWDLKNQHGQAVAAGVYICVIKSPAGNTTVKKIAVIE